MDSDWSGGTGGLVGDCSQCSRSCSQFVPSSKLQKGRNVPSVPTLSLPFKDPKRIHQRVFLTYWEQWEHWEQAPEMSGLRRSQLVFGDWEHWEQQWTAALN
jgi:hypothetical protein